MLETVRENNRFRDTVEEVIVQERRSEEVS